MYGCGARGCPPALVAYILFIYIGRMTALRERLSRCEGFEWDAGNEGKNWQKHGVLDGECEQVFFNRPLVAAPDARHSEQEERIHVLGQTDSGRPLFLVCTIRDARIRVISARPMSRAEREEYRRHE